MEEEEEKWQIRQVSICWFWTTVRSVISHISIHYSFIVQNPTIDI